MAETGWPLIPREVLPAPVAAVRRPKRPPAPADSGRQLTIFGAGTLEESTADLAGLLAGPGRLGRMGGTARVSVEVDAAWRVHVLVAELVARGLVVSWHPIRAANQDQQIETADVRESGSPDRDDDPRGHSGTARPDPPAPTGRPAPRGSTEAPSSAARPPHTRDESAAPGDDGFKRRLSHTRDESAAPEDDGFDRPGGEEEFGETEHVDEVDRPDPAADSVGGVAIGSGGGADRSVDAGAEDDRPGPAVVGFEVRTAYSSRLNYKTNPSTPAADRLFLSGPGLRLWVAAGGEPRPGGYALRLDPVDNLEIAASALVRAGLAGTVPDHGTHYLISGRKRLRRLAELVGECPAAAPPQLWPGGATA